MLSLDCHLIMHFFLKFLSYTGCFFCSVLECAEPSIPRHLLVAVIAFIITVVQLVIKGAQRQSSFVLDQKIFITSMCHCSTGSLIDDMENQMYWMARKNSMNAKRRKIEKVFHGMHRQSRPRADVYVSMMEGVYFLVDERNM